jgi:hypothetical protein
MESAHPFQYLRTIFSAGAAVVVVHVTVVPSGWVMVVVVDMAAVVLVVTALEGGVEDELGSPSARDAHQGAMTLSWQKLDPFPC